LDIVQNHGISEERIEAALGAGKKFFDLPRSKKMEVR
jgi:isopenicillin N synthase-like dioxygenase